MFRRAEEFELDVLTSCGWPVGHRVDSLGVGRVGEDGYAGKGVEERETCLFGDVKALGDVEAGEVPSTREGGERCISDVDQAKQVERFQHRLAISSL